MSKYFLSLAVLFLSIEAYADYGKQVKNIQEVKGYYSDGNNCIKVSSAYLKRVSYCLYEPVGNTHVFTYQCFFISKKKQTSDYIFDTKKECDDEQAIEESNSF